MSFILGTGRVLGRIPIALSCSALFFLMTLTFCDVLMRSMLNAPIEAATELARMSVAIVVFSALPVLSARGGHISVDLLDGIIARVHLTRLRDAVMALACGGMLYWPAQRVGVLAERARSYGDLTEYLNLPVFYMGWFIAGMTWVTAGVLILRGLMLIFAPRLIETPA